MKMKVSRVNVHGHQASQRASVLVDKLAHEKKMPDNLQLHLTEQIC